jgi:hypothetical protein
VITLTHATNQIFVILIVDETMAFVNIAEWTPHHVVQWVQGNAITILYLNHKQDHD